MEDSKQFFALSGSRLPNDVFIKTATYFYMFLIAVSVVLFASIEGNRAWLSNFNGPYGAIVKQGYFGLTLFGHSRHFSDPRIPHSIFASIAEGLGCNRITGVVWIYINGGGGFFNHTHTPMVVWDRDAGASWINA